MNVRPIDGYIPMAKEAVMTLTRTKISMLLLAEAKEHERQIRDLMTGRTKFSWWSGHKPAPDISFEEAKAEYESPADEDDLSSRIYGTAREIVISRYEDARKRCNVLQDGVRNAVEGETVLISTDALSWLKSA